MTFQTQVDALLYLSTVIFSAGMMAWRMERRGHFAVRCIACVAALAGAMSLMVFLLEFIVIAVPSMVQSQVWLHILRFTISFLLVLCSVKICFDCDLWGALFCANTGYCIQHVSARLDSIINDFLLPKGTYWVVVSLKGILIAAIVFGVFWAIALRGAPKRQRLLTTSRWQIVIATCVVGITIFYNTFGIVYANEFIRLSEKNGSGLLYARGSLLFVYIMSSLIALLALMLDLSIRSNEGLSEERNRLTCILEDGKRQYEREKTNIELLNLRLHDLKHQLAAMRGKIYEEQIEELTEAVNFYDASMHTGNEALDVVLTQKTFYCTEHGITFTCLINGANYNFIPQHEVYALFNNMIDNAIEAVEKLPEEKRVISVTEQSRPGFLSVRIRNYCKAAPVFRDGLPVSSKKEEGHGYGMKSIKLIVEKYNGGLSVKAEEGLFVLDIYFQLM